MKAQGLFFAHFRTLFLASFGSGGVVGALAPASSSEDARLALAPLLKSSAVGGGAPVRVSFGDDAMRALSAAFVAVSVSESTDDKGVFGAKSVGASCWPDSGFTRLLLLNEGRSAVAAVSASNTPSLFIMD